MHYVKQYKEDKITFKNSTILLEIQWQSIIKGVETSYEKKKPSNRREKNMNIEAIKQIQNDKNFL